MSERDWILAIDGSQRSEPLVILVLPSGDLAWSPAAGLADPWLIGATRQALEAHRDRIGQVVATRGPGSYMGVRGGLAAATGASQALRCPLALVGSLEVVGRQIDPGEESVLALADAGRGGSFGQILDPAPGGQLGSRWLPRGATELLSRDAPWPAWWSQAKRAVGFPGEGREVPSATILAPPSRERREALAWIASSRPTPIPGYDHIRADYAEPVGARPWS